MITCKMLQQKPQSFKRLTGITIDEFNNLLGKIMPIWAEDEQRRLTRPNRQRTIGGGRTYSLDLQDQLLMTLMWLHLSLNTEALGFFLVWTNQPSAVIRAGCGRR